MVKDHLRSIAAEKRRLQIRINRAILKVWYESKDSSWQYEQIGKYAIKASKRLQELQPPKVFQ